MHSSILKLSLTSLIGLIPLVSIASTSHKYFQEQIENINNERQLLHQAYDIGDRYDVASGTLLFQRKDISIPGNSDLQVSYGITYETSYPEYFGWMENIPRIEISSGVASDGEENTPLAWLNGNYCSGSQRRQSVHWEVSSSTFYDRAKLIIPDENIKGYLLENNGVVDSNTAQYPYVTVDNWKFECFTSPITGKEGFKAYSPNGNLYYFDIKTKYVGTLTGEKPEIPFLSDIEESVATFVEKEPTALFVSKIEDRFGNWVKYEYDHHRSISNVRRIYSNDGRSISVTRNDKGTTVYAEGQKWQYEIERKGSGGSSGHNRNELTVIQPDGLQWTYDLDISESISTTDSDGEPICGHHFKPDHYYIDRPMTVKSPWGAVTEFRFEFIRSDRSNISSGQFQYRPDFRRCHFSYALKEKVVKFGEKTYKDTYDYSENYGVFDIESSNPMPSSLISLPIPQGINRADHKTVTITSLDGTKKKYYINRKFRTGQFNTVSAIEYFNRVQPIPILTEFFTYTTSPTKGISYQHGKDTFELKPRLSVHKKQYSNGDVVTTSYSDFNTFDMPENKVVRDDSTGYTRHYRDTYIHDLNSWTLNLPSKSYISNTSSFAPPYKEVLYDNNYQPHQIKDFGRVALVNYYHTDGTLSKVQYNGTNRYEQFDNYYRGLPRKITYPCSITNKCNTVNGSTLNTVVSLFEVNGNGTLKSHTDFNGQKINYSYNSMGWLTKIDYADPKWVDKVVSYATADDVISGSDVAEGGLRQTITQGNFESMVYHDGLLRPVFTRTRDKTDAGTISYQRNEYDHENRVTLASFPSSDPANRLGMATEYDALGRVVTQTRTSDNAITHTAYLTGNKIAVTDPMNNTTTTTLLAYAEPAYDKPTLIEAPNTNDVVIDYNFYDQITTIRQGSITESRFYDGYQQLCKSVRPETGITAYGYNAHRQPIWRALGTSGSTTSCDAAAVPAADKVTLAYNNQGMLASENFPDTTPDETYTYDPNGNLTRLQAGSIIWSYEYNSQNTIDKETLTLDSKSFVLDWEYNSLGAVSSLKYPSGVLVDYAPNALGQPTKAGTYASAVKYHPNGQIKQFTYGNGIVRNVALDTTGRIDAITDQKTATLLSLDPSYDNNDNLARLIDWKDRTSDVDNLTYDGVNRLLTADGRWGTGRYSYDGLGNVLSRSLNNSTISYQYNGLNRLVKLSGAYAYGYQYDKRGNVTNNGRYVVAYNLGQQMTSAKGIGYLYDGHNRRVRKTENGLHSYSVYSQAGQLLHRVDEAGKKTDSIYLGRTIVAEVDDPGSVYSINNRCTGSGGSKTATTTACGDGSGSDR